MAPEQVEGKTVTQAADVYALGAVAFEMLTGRVPFAGESPTSVALARLSQTAPAPSSLVPALGADWDLLIGRCLKRKPGDRFADMPELAKALEAMRTRTDGCRPSSWLTVSLSVALVMALTIAIVSVSAGVTTWARSAPPAEIKTATVGRTVVAPPPAVLVLDPPAAQEPPPLILLRQSRHAPRLSVVHRPRSTAAVPEPVSPPVARPVSSHDPLLTRPTQSRPRNADDLINPF
jgi:serine/threonine-protein kinase